MKTIYLDCRGVKSIDDFWRLYVDVMRVQTASGFGRNLDAFWDAVEGGGPGSPGEAKLVFENSASLVPLQLANGTSFLAALQLFATQTTHVEMVFA
ncbi:barstar family protein [Ferrovibrio terrae]|uniref:barstar family protein n=1 Tax=Ferrovibrio terrae TaxID=2594003 RepID=UPI003137DCBF